jgi:hypothetical protein
MQKSTVLAVTLAASTLGFGLAANMPAAHALSLVPQTEGEVKLTNIPCILNAANCIDTQATMGYTVTSLAYDRDGIGPQYGLSRLFVDKNSTANNWGFGITFPQQDAGTNPALNQYWFRPVAYRGANPNSAPTGNPAENGQLEVGRYLFNLGQTVSKLTLDFFDVEDANFSGIVQVNGTPFSQLVAAGPDGNINSLTLRDVSSFVVQLGKPGPNSVFSRTGDGVRLQATAVPEPTTTLSLAALAVAGMMGLRQRKKASDQA